MKPDNNDSDQKKEKEKEIKKEICDYDLEEAYDSVNRWYSNLRYL